LTAIRLTASETFSMPQNCHPDRSAAQWRDLLFLHDDKPIRHD
jgi:hypothetical protein